MPKPRKGESRNSYVSRAVKMMTNKEGMSQKQAVGKAEGMYNYYTKKKTTKRKKK